MKLPLLMFLLFGNCARAEIIASIDGFTPAEQNVIGYVVGQWQSWIGDLVSLDLLIRKDPLPSGVSASTDQIQVDASGLPHYARITINDDPSAFFPWFIDPTPNTNEEFAAGKRQDSW